MCLVLQRFRISNGSQRVRKAGRSERKTDNRHLHSLYSRNDGRIDGNRGAKTTGYIGNRGEPEIKRVRKLGLLHRGVATVELGMGPGRTTGVHRPRDTQQTTRVTTPRYTCR